MEESTEAHMETDVSSTTEDVPETQEVTGSNGSVEMVIVVEQMKEDEDISDVQIGEQPADDEGTNKLPKQSEESSQVDTETQESPPKSPNKDIEPMSSPESNLDLEQNVVNKNLQLDSDIEHSAPIKQMEDADSSMKDVVVICYDDTPKSSPNSPNKTQETYVEDSPEKEAPTPVHVSPTKQLQLSESTRSTPTKEPLLVERIAVNGKVQSNDNSNDSIIKTLPDITIERDINDSQESKLETNTADTNMSDLSEKEHKGISRELKSLINSAKESKIISECTQLTSKTRKSRSALDTSLNTSIEGEKIGYRRNSTNSQKSNCSEKSEKQPVKRSMRSQNPEFVSKVKQFLNSVTGKSHKESDDEDDDEEKVSKDKGNKGKNDENDSSSPPKMRKTEPIVLERPGKLRSDSYCWRCHWVLEQGTEKIHGPMLCTVCPRSFHFKCLSSSERSKISSEKSWVCPECMIILQAESSETRSQAMKKTSLGTLCELLKHALERMMDLNGVEPFLQPVDRASFPDYDKYVVHPMDLSLMKSNIEGEVYGSTEAFLADAQWILHNSIIFNTLQSKLTGAARALVRSCRAEMCEIEACPQCYAAAHAHKPTWFTDVCTTPHILLWAKLKGFPYWPAKGMSVSGAGHVDVRFFGAHDRAWVPAKDCFLYSEKDPNNFRTKRQDIIDSMQEAEQHIRNISRKYGKFVYPPFKTQFDPSKLSEQLKMMIPSFEGEVRTATKEKSTASSAANKEKRRSYSKSSKESYNEGEVSENEDTHEGEESSTAVSSRKMADGAEIAREEEESTIEKEVPTETSPQTTTSETPTQSNKSSESSRKRRRSALEEATITIMETHIEPKRKKSDKLEKKKSQEQQEPSSTKETDDKIESQDADKTTNGLTEEDISDDSAQKDNEPSSSTKSDQDKERNQRVTPIRIALVQKDRRHNLRTSTTKEAMAKIISPTKDKDKNNEKTTPVRQKSFRAEKAGEKTPKEDKFTKAIKRRNSRNNRSLTSTPKADRQRRISLEKKAEKAAEASSNKDKTKESAKEKEKAKDNAKENKDKATDNSKENKDKPTENSKENNPAKESTVTTNEKETEKETEKSKKDKRSTNSPRPANAANTEGVKSVKDRLQFDDDTSLAVIARESRTVVISSNNQSGLPTISSVRSLSITAQNTATTSSKTITTTNTADVRVEPVPDLVPCSSTPTTTDKEKNAKDASKLQKIRNDAEPMVGRVGVRAFARMSSIEQSPSNKNAADDVQVEIKAEPIDVDDSDRHTEKMNLMNAFKLRPVNPSHTTSNLREVRINKVLVTPLNAKKTATKPVEVRPRAKKTFPQPKKPEDGQLNSKNSMVYIPIQPPMTQAPVRPPRVVAGPTCPPPTVKPANAASSSANSLVNTVTTPVMQVSSIVTSPPCSTITTSASLPTVGAVGALGTVPAAVHTVPLMTSVNGQWMFSFQPVMSVGAIENSPSPPILNGVSATGGPSLVPLSAGATNNKAPTDTSAPGEPPRLQQRPATILMNPLDANTPIGIMPTPSTAGPVTAKLNQNAVKLTDFFRTLLEDSIEKLDEPATAVTSLKLQLEQAKWKHQAEIKEVKHNHELTIAEMRALFEKEKARAVADARRAASAELEAAVKAAKGKQWCANCMQEAQFYCCWNTSYCDYPCQRAHWAKHFNLCTQQRTDGKKKGEPPAPTDTRSQSQPESLPKNSCAPALTVGGKLAPPTQRAYTQDTHSNTTQKNAIIVSMVEDQSGNQTMKCVGTYKSPQNLSPIILNKQIMNSEENANKKVVSSGGYLIVGGGSNNSAVVTPARRTHTIQYFS